MTAYLLTIGDEILIGQIVDTNSAWMSRQLNLQGIRVVGKSSVGDVREAIVEGLEHALALADIVLTTGGLGPTKDDITKRTIADWLGSDMVFHEETYERIVGYFTKIGRATPPVMRQQAIVPEQADILPNKVGSAPGMWFERAGKVLVSMPGVPFEMEYLMQAEVLPRLKAKFPGRPIAHRTLQTAGEGESNIAQRIAHFEENLPPNVKLAYLPALGAVRLRLSGIWEEDPTEQSANRLREQMDSLQSDLQALIPDLVFGYEDDTLQAVVGKLLQERGLQLGTAESCTGGYVAHQITLTPGASAWYPGSVVTYSYAMKTRMLGVRPDTLQQYGAVSEETVREMALGALERLGVDIALSISGIAGPDGGTPDKPVGTVWMAVASRERVVAQKHLFGRDRLKNIQLTGVYALNMVRKFLLEER